MVKGLLGDAERIYILHGVQEHLRVDGRDCMDYRLIEIETDVLSNCSGSAHIKLANTDLLVGVKAELSSPDPQYPNRGKIKFFVDCSPNANPEFEGRGGDDIALEITQILKQSFNNTKCLDLDSLCVIPEVQVWVLYVDIVILECSGNLADAASIAVKAALYDTKIPAVSIATDGDSQPEIEVSDDPYNVVRLDVSNVPCVVTLLRVGSKFIVDASIEEEECSNSKLIMAVSPDGVIMLTKKLRSGSLHPDSILDVLEIGQELEVRLHTTLMEKLKAEEMLKKTKKGYLT